jgi:hypothetical protein
MTKNALIKMVIAFPVILHASDAQNWPENTVINEGVFLESIAEVENSAGKIGKKGEMTPWQIMPTTWCDYTIVPIDEADTDTQAKVALRILRHYSSILTKRGIMPNVYNLALAWNGGPSRKEYPPSSVRYAERVSNAYTARMKGRK